MTALLDKMINIHDTQHNSNDMVTIKSKSLYNKIQDKINIITLLQVTI